MSAWGFPNQATPAGSPVYYAVRFSDESLRDRYALLFAWFEQVSRCAANPTDPGVARLKLDWWRKELGLLGEGRASHPLAVEMRAAGLHDTALLLHLQSFIDATDDEITARATASEQAFAEHCRHAGGARFLALGTVARSNADEHGLRAAGALYEAVGRIGRAVAEPRRLPPPLRAEALARLNDRERAARLEQVLAPFDSLDRAGACRLLPDVAARLALLGLALRRKMRALGYPVHARPVERAPIANLWTAWRCR